ncbi:MAG TPA: beta-L-arabinofuranosidase domain-containing protein, partial [Opitutaceae bacterium]|nr:beta-L-arabinofuranosidase domain-containing protein [Opitutaceae bacterium]
RNFDLAAEVMRRRAHGEPHFQIVPPTLFPFDDTDAYKAIEAASYVLNVHPDPALDRLVDSWIARIAAAQEPDGYLYTFRTMHPDTPGHKWVGRLRWENDPILSHELYDCGHLFEAGYAHFQATGKRTLLDVCLKNADLLWRDFGDGRLRIAPGHEIVEMGLAKLYRATGDERYLKLARIFLDARGPGGPSYNQRQALVVDQTEAVGHAVRANYLYSGMADVAALTGDTRYENAIKAIWDNVADTKLYLTGGVGALAKGEAYGADYELPNDAYNETCAACALMFWNERMFLLTGESKYVDVLERTAYNGFISGVSLSGDRFFYPNPLVYDGHSKNNSGFAGRAPWFGCACCPPNLMRTLASLTGYFYAVRGDSLYVNLYAQSQGAVRLANTDVEVVQATDYPWQGRVRLTLSVDHPATFTLRLRIPGWAQGRPVPSDLYAFDGPTPDWALRVGGQPADRRLADGYAVITREWRSGDVVELDLPMPVRTVRGNAQVAADRGLVAFERGPVVYCAEDLKGDLPLGQVTIPAEARVAAAYRPDLLGGVVALQVSGARAGAAPADFTAIPYFAWDNRGLAPMAVWLRSGPREDVARSLPAPASIRTN